MGTIKDIIRKKYIELDDVKAVVSEDLFKEHVGVSIKTFKKKLWKVDNAIDQFAFKVIEPKSNSHISISFSKAGIDRHPVFYTPGYNSNLGIKITVSEAFSEETFLLPTLSYCLPVHIFPGESTHSFLELPSENKQQNDNAFIRSLKETYGVDWEIVYEKLMGFKQVFSILLKIEQVLFDDQNNAFNNSFSRQFFYEYFDLISTLKKWGSHTTVSAVNHPYYSTVKSNNNEKKGFSIASCFLN